MIILNRKEELIEDLYELALETEELVARLDARFAITDNKKLRKIYDLLDVDGDNVIRASDDVKCLGEILKKKKLQQLEDRKKNLELTIKDTKDATPYSILLQATKLKKDSKFTYKTLESIEKLLSRLEWESVFDALKINEIKRLQKTLGATKTQT